MTRNPVMNLWAAIVAALLTLCTSLGLITTTAVAAVPDPEPTRNTEAPQDVAAPEEPVRDRPPTCSLPPTMKQRIHAEAHGSSPSCRNRPLTDATTPDTSAGHDSAPDSGARASGTRDIAVPAQAGPSGRTGSTTGSMDTGTTTAVPAAQPGGRDTVLLRASATTTYASAAPGTEPVPLAGVVLPAQSPARAAAVIAPR
ncbi:DUF6344 domain-containing protein [Streptomyces beigongshangae]|uniref:DUF6344 domain-containing protein n=1 Tax=Streptomyces beigongshangae TaxID=2841597 RepID=UPI001C85D5FF|nr:DUF6344 domain-containing protein [Streptomyces sp. REN17]